MSNVVDPHPHRGLCEVHYDSVTSIGYRFRPGLILTASEDEKLGDPKSVDLGNGDIRLVRLLASQTGLRGRVSLLAFTGDSKLSVEVNTADFAGPDRPIDFTPAIALRADGTTTGHFLNFQGSDRRVDFVATNGSAGLPIGTPVFFNDQFVGIAARSVLGPEQLFLTIVRLLILFGDAERRKLIEEATHKLLGDQLLALVRSFQANVTRIWSLYELVGSSEFKPYLEETGAVDLQSITQTEVSAQRNAARVISIFQGGAEHHAETVIIESAPSGLWVPLERAPQYFPIAPKPSAAWIITLLLLAVAAVLALIGVPLDHPF